jgi:hypothetical protein
MLYSLLQEDHVKFFRNGLTVQYSNCLGRMGLKIACAFRS